MKIFRQGDVLVKEIKSIPKSLKKEDKCILAYSEISGHKHQILESGSLYKNGTQQFLQMEQEGILQHEEHSAISIPKGTYEVVIQREFDLLGQVRQVMD